MQTMINLAVKFSGLGWVWDKVDGYKTKGSAVIGILTALLGLSNELAPLLAHHDAGGLFNLLKHLPTDKAWLTLLASVGTLGIGHKLEKAAATDATPDAAPAAAPSVQPGDAPQSA